MSRRLALLAALAAATFTTLPSHAAAPGLGVSAQGAPVSVPGSYRVAVVVHNAAASYVCSDVALTIRWFVGDTRGHTMSATVTSTAGLATTTFTLPDVRKGTLRYVVYASQTCGLFTQSDGYRGQTPEASARIA